MHSAEAVETFFAAAVVEIFQNNAVVIEKSQLRPGKTDTVLFTVVAVLGIVPLKITAPVQVRPSMIVLPELLSI